MSNNYEKLLVHVTGMDVVGILTKVTHLLSKWDISLLDIQQTITLQNLSLSLLLSLNREAIIPIKKQLEELSVNLHLNIEVSLLDNTRDLYLSEHCNTFAITMITDHMSIQKYHLMVEQITNNAINIMQMKQLAYGVLQCVELIVQIPSGGTDILKRMSKQLFFLATALDIDISIQPENLFRHSKRLVIMDMDSTLIQQEVIDELAKEAGVQEQVKKITREAMLGNIDFKTSLKKRVMLLKGLPKKKLDVVKRKIQLTPGAESLISLLQYLGYKTAIISGGFGYFTRYWHKKLGLDYSFANILEIDQGVLTGNLLGDIVDSQRKADLLYQISQKEKIPLGQTVAIGDGANDIPMLTMAGLGIAFNAKPIVKENAKAFLTSSRLDTVLLFLGISQKEVEKIQQNINFTS